MEKGQNLFLDGMADAQAAGLPLPSQTSLTDAEPSAQGALKPCQKTAQVTVGVSFIPCSDSSCQLLLSSSVFGSPLQMEVGKSTFTERYSTLPILFTFKTCISSVRFHEVLASSPHYETPQAVNYAGGKSPGLQKENLF